MRIHRIAIVLVFIGSLAACYGTKVAPPLRSPTAPPGLGGPSSLSSPVAIPPDLPGLLAIYRRSLIEQSHHLSHAAADSYADAEIKSLTSRYSGRDNELKDEIVRLLRPISAKAVTPTGKKAKSSGYPVDAVSETRGAGQ